MDTKAKSELSGKRKATPDAVSARTTPIVNISVHRGHYLSDGTGFALSVTFGSVTLYFGWSSWKAPPMAGRASLSMGTVPTRRARRPKAVSSSDGATDQPSLLTMSES